MSLKSLIKVADYYNVRYGFGKKAAEEEMDSDSEEISEAEMNKEFFERMDRFIDQTKYDGVTYRSPERKKDLLQYFFNKIVQDFGKYLSDEEYLIVKRYVDKLIRARIKLDELNKTKPGNMYHVGSFAVEEAVGESLNEFEWAYMDLRDSKVPQED
jgi:hypothetical protein